MRRRRVEADVLVFGSGLTGCLVALELARARRRVAVVDLEGDDAPAPGHVPSGPAVTYVEAVRRWGREGARELWERQREAHVALRGLIGEWRLQDRHRDAGGFTVAATRAEGSALAASEDLLREDGFTGEFVDGYMLEARFAVQGFTAAYWAEGEAEVDGAALARAAGAAARDAGVLFAGAPAREPPDLSSRGARLVTADARVTAPVAVLASPRAAALAGAYFEARLTWRAGRALRCPIPAGCAVPSPARTVDRHAGWTVSGTELVVRVPGEGEPGAFVDAHLPDVRGPRRPSVPLTAATSGDGLPWAGALPEGAVVAALAGADDLGYLPLLARWAAVWCLTGRDPTPPLLRAARGSGGELSPLVARRRD